MFSSGPASHHDPVFVKGEFLPDLQGASLQMVEIAEFGDGDPGFFGDAGKGVPLQNGIGLFAGR